MAISSLGRGHFEFQHGIIFSRLQENQTNCTRKVVQAKLTLIARTCLRIYRLNASRNTWLFPYGRSNNCGGQSTGPRNGKKRRGRT